MVVVGMAAAAVALVAATTVARLAAGSEDQKDLMGG